MNAITKPGPRATIGASLLRRILAGETRNAKLEHVGAPAAEASIYPEGAPVWLWLPAPTPAMVNPLTGERGVWAEAVVIGYEAELVVVVTSRMALKGPVFPVQLRPRNAGEIAPGRMKFGPGNGVSR